MAIWTTTKAATLLGSSLASAILAASTLLATGGPAIAQTAPPDVSHVVVRAGATPLRSGPGLDWYAVANLSPGTVLRADAQVEGWYKVGYPEGLPAVVRTLKGELRDGGTVVVLTSNDALGSYNLEKPFTEDCYKRIFAERQLPPGTRLKYLGPIENRRGELAGYKVVAPPGAKGYILPADVRPATSEEVRAFEGLPAESVTMGAPSKATPSVTTAPERTAEPKATPVPHTTPTTTATTPAPAPVSAENDATDTEVVVFEETIETTDLGGESGDAPAVFMAESLDDLDAAYKRVMTQGLDTAEFDQLIGEYAAYRDALPDSEDAAIEREYVNARIEVLEIRADVQQRMRALATLEADTESAQYSLEQFVKGVQIARGYAVVGRLSPSIVYDGQRLPRMYRITSVDANSGGRTLAYILPAEDLGLVGKLGAIVGIMGEDDPTARRGEVRVIRPTAAEVLETE